MRLAFDTVKWEDGRLIVLDQTQLPNRVVYRELKDVNAVATAIQQLMIRGAPLIGVVAAYGVAVAAYQANTKEEIIAAIAKLRETRPTAYNLFYAMDLMRRILDEYDELEPLRDEILQCARKLHEEDRQICDMIGEHGEPLIPDGARVLTHCNAGALATTGIGTALAPIYKSWERGKSLHVYVGETRPALQGARLTGWELMQTGIPVTLVVDNVRGYMFEKDMIDLVIIGADRITKNGDVVNKIGSYEIAVLAKHHNTPFYVAAPYTTFDPDIEKGTDVTIEERDPHEVTEIAGTKIAPDGIKVFNPVFDVVSHELITGYITEKGVVTKFT